MLTQLKPREADILKLRHGFLDDKEMTLEEIGEQFGVTRERIRQIEARAIRKLSNPKRINILHAFFDESIQEKS